MPERLTSRSVEKLLAAGVPGDYRDAITRGLVLRIKAQSHSWNFRRRLDGHDYRIDLGDLWTLEEARTLAAELHRRLVANMMSLAIPASWSGWNKHLDMVRRAKLGLPREEEPPAPKPVVRRRTWTWEQAIESWSEALKRDKRGITHLDYIADLNVAEMRVFRGRYVADIARKEVSKALTKMHKRGVERSGEKTCGSLKRFFDFLGHDTQTDDSGVEEGRMSKLRPEKRRTDLPLDPRKRLRVPDGQMVGQLMVRFRDPAATTAKRPTKSTQRLASLLTLYTVQRRTTVCTAHKAEFEEVPGRGGLWHQPNPHRKSGSRRSQQIGTLVGDHVVPLPPQAWAVVQEAMGLEPDCPFLFNSSRRRRAGMSRNSLNPSTLTHLWSDVEGNVVTPHDMRRAFASTYKKVAGLTDRDLKLVLDHKAGTPSNDVTRRHYDLNSVGYESWPTMIGWCAWVDEQAALLSPESVTRAAAE